MITMQSVVPECPEDFFDLPMVSIPAGTFLMGSPLDEPGHYSDEGPQHQVTLEAFQMSQFPITQAQWQAVMGNNPSYFKNEANSGQRPVERVSWHDAMAFCAQLSKITNRNYTLPSEAQWEYACRAGTVTPFHFGGTISSTQVSCDGHETTPVGMFPPSNWGLYDMHGNVWEWCLDHWHSNYEGAPEDGSPWLDANAKEDGYRLLRGGPWGGFPRLCRSAYRYRNQPGNVLSFVGFRVVCLPQGPAVNSQSINPSAWVCLS